MIPVKKMVQKLYLAFLGLAISAMAMGQTKTITLEWGKDNPSNTFTITSTDTIKLTIAKIPADSIDEFFNWTIIKKVNKFKDTLYTRIKNEEDKAHADSIILDHQKKKNITSFLITNYLALNAGDSVVIWPLLSNKKIDTVNAKPLIIRVLAKETTQSIAPPPSNPGNKTVSIFYPVGTSIFIPAGKMESQWATQFGCCEFLTAPSLNKHTRWAITYDFNKQDPVAAWRRGNQTPADGGCCGTENPDEKTAKKNKNKKSDENIAIKIAEEVAKLEKEWLALELLVKDTVLNQRAIDIRKQMTDLRGQIKPGMNEDDRKKALDELDKIKENIGIIRAMNGVKQVNPLYTGLEKGCCSVVYCGIQTKRMAPTVKRSTLISVVNFHPYRDSFSLSISYDNHFGQDMATFNSAFATATGQGTSGQDTATKDPKKTTPLAGETKSDSADLGLRYYQLFDILRKELKWYYTSKIQQTHLDVKVVENGVNYIKQQMNDSLGITDFTEAGIVKRAEEVADFVKHSSKPNLEDFFIMAREAGAWWSKIANYKIFDSKSVLVQNKDLMNIVLKKYTYGKLVTSDEEATRSYYTSGGFKIDFSVGLFANFLVDEQFTTKSVKIGEDTTRFRLPNGTDSILSTTPVNRDSIIRDERGKFNIGPAVYTHFYWRTGFDINISGTIGLAINQQALPRYLFGGSLLIGRDQRLVLTGGLACGPTKTLASGLKESDKILISSYANSTLPTKDVWRNSWFVGVSWNFAGIAVGR